MDSGGRRRPPHLLCFYSGHFRAEADSAAAFDSVSKALTGFLQSGWQFVVRVPHTGTHAVPEPLTTSSVHAALRHAHKRSVFAPPAAGTAKENRQGAARRFAWDRHCVEFNTTYPLAESGQLHIAMAVPWLKLGGVDQCVIQLSRAIRRLVPDARLHLVATKEGIECSPDKLRIFDEMVLLGALDWERRTRVCDVVFRSMDLVINGHSEAAYDSLKWRVERPGHGRGGVHLSYLHVIDQNRRGQLVGFPPQAAKLEHGIDGFAVISDDLRSFLINDGVNASKIRVARNAAVVRPPSLSLALETAATKARRRACGERPLRLLFAGRADYQKGMSRLKGMVDLLVTRAAPFHLTLVGSSVLGEEPVRWPAAYVTNHPATHEDALLATHYAEADVFVLLSRWEGVPLSLLDAMAYGCVVVATDVGGVSELVDNGKNGFLVPNDKDDDVAAQAADLVGRVLQDRTGAAAMRDAAVRTAWRHTWDNAAKTLLSFLPDAVKAEHGLGRLWDGLDGTR